MSDTQEIWVDIENYEGCYQISNKGRVKSLERECRRVRYMTTAYSSCTKLKMAYTAK